VAAVAVEDVLDRFVAESGQLHRVLVLREQARLRVEEEAQRRLLVREFEVYEVVTASAVVGRAGRGESRRIRRGFEQQQVRDAARAAQTLGPRRLVAAGAGEVLDEVDDRALVAVVRPAAVARGAVVAAGLVLVEELLFREVGDDQLLVRRVGHALGVVALRLCRAVLAPLGTDDDRGQRTQARRAAQSVERRLHLPSRVFVGLRARDDGGADQKGGAECERTQSRTDQLMFEVDGRPHRMFRHLAAFFACGARSATA
jgi:hypothetical protein